MTRETAKIKVELLDNYLSHTCQDYGERDHEAMMMAIKALEQEPILDKINEIIEPLRHLSIDQMSDIEWDILRVTDKYKAETEEI